ncbi:hypothetical protein [Glaciecola petra]|uniref:Uncharacterized protein n=1 Tax=Glaciecola petra TaxID=3075602 RepID=A0ABU2ZU70_9ALTE|nr:hypothetical protein [Aestuariibacter sp. P117]MDT0595955.1 hypothetical protein [Aestuariibacter sp. P117]
MMKRLSVSFLFLCLFSVVAIAQTPASPSLFGDDEQPGNRLHEVIAAKMANGEAKNAAIVDAIKVALTDADNSLNGEAKSAVAFDIPLAEQFYVQMVDVNSLIEVTKVLIEENASKAIHVITLGTVLYPDFAQEVFDGAALSGVMAPEDILVAVLQAGADATTVSDPTAIGGDANTNIAVTPLGAGIGAGGTGGGDTTASTN